MIHNYLDISSFHPPMGLITSLPKLLCPVSYPLPVGLNDPGTFLEPPRDPYLIRTFQDSWYRPFQPIPRVVALLPCPPFCIPPEILYPITLAMKFGEKQHQMTSLVYLLFQHSLLL